MTPAVAIPVPGLPPSGLPPQLGRVIAQLMLSDVRRRFTTATAPDGSAWRPLGKPRASGGDKPLRDTGELLASLSARSDTRGAVVGTTHPAAALQNFGGVVRPKSAKSLAIPLTREAKRASSPRRFRRELEWRPAKRRGVSLLVEVLAGRRPGKPRETPQYLLVPQATVPARPFMGLSADGLKRIGEALAEYVAKNWSGGQT